MKRMIGISATLLLLVSSSVRADQKEIEFVSKIENSAKITCSLKGSIFGWGTTKLVFDAQSRAVTGRVNRNDDLAHSFYSPWEEMAGIGKADKRALPSTAGWRLNGTTLLYEPVSAGYWINDDKVACADHMVIVEPRLASFKGLKFVGDLKFRWCHPHPDFGLQEMSEFAVKCAISPSSRPHQDTEENHGVPSGGDGKSPRPCGLSGSFDERIADCAKLPDSKKDHWSLVTRTQRLKEVWEDELSRLYWGDTLTRTFGTGDPELLQLMTVGSGMAGCASMRDENGGLPGITFRLPSAQDYEGAIAHGLSKVLSKKGAWYWTSTPNPGPWGDYLLFTGSGFDGCDSDVNGAIRCVGTPMH